MKRRFSDWRNYCCLLYRTEYKYSGFAMGKFGKYEGDSGNRVWCDTVNRRFENHFYLPHPEIYSFAKLPLTTNPSHPALPLRSHKNSSNL